MLEGLLELPSAGYGNTKKSCAGNLSGIWIFTVVCVVCCLVYYGAGSIRGTDQYWYLADVETLIEGNPPVSNAYFPGMLLRGDVGPTKLNYFYHNGPMVHISALLGRYTGGYKAWILVNLLCHFSVALAIYLGVRKVTSAVNARIVATLYLVSPLALWQTMSMLLEQYFAGVMSLIVIGYCYRDRAFGGVLFVVSILIGTLSHPVFVAIGLAAGASYVFYGVPTKSYRSIVGGLLLLLCVIALGQAVDVIYPTGFFPRLSIAVANVTPDMEVIPWYFAEQGNSISASMLVAKARHALAQQFLSPAYLPFNIFTNVALLTWLWLFVFYREVYGDLIVAAGFVLGLYLGLIVLMQHQPRYQQLVSPVVFILVSIAIYKCPRVPRRLVGFGIFALAVVMGGYLSHLSHQKAELQRQEFQKQQADIGFSRLIQKSLPMTASAGNVSAIWSGHARYLISNHVI